MRFIVCYAFGSLQSCFCSPFFEDGETHITHHHLMIFNTLLTHIHTISFEEEKEESVLHLDGIHRLLQATITTTATTTKVMLPRIMVLKGWAYSDVLVA